MTDFELVKSRLDARAKGTPMDMKEANEIFKGTTVYIYYDNNSGKFGWSAIMSENRGFNTVRSAVNNALEYLERDGY